MSEPRSSSSITDDGQGTPPTLRETNTIQSTKGTFALKALVLIAFCEATPAQSGSHARAAATNTRTICSVWFSSPRSSEKSKTTQACIVVSYSNSSWHQRRVNNGDTLNAATLNLSAKAGAFAYYPCKSKRVGASTHSFTRIRKVTASLPSTTRWS